MTVTLHHPDGTLRDGDQRVVVTPGLAGWTYCGLRVLQLPPGGSWTHTTGSAEMLALPLSGSFSVECEGRRFDLDGRPDVFSRVTDFAYVPVDAQVRIASRRGGQVALPSARATRRLDPAYGAAQDVPVELRGAGHAARQVNNFCAPDAFDTDKLIAVELLTPAGNWSSYPPHKHDELREGEAVLEEIYYFRVAGRDGFAFHRTYTTDGQIDETVTVRDGDVFLVPRGYHGPCVAAPDYHLYYLNVLAGPAPQRTMAFCDDPAHAWVRDGWPQQQPDPRLPMCDADGPRETVGRLRDISP